MKRSDPIDLRARHLRIGWWGLLLFIALGLTLEAFHGWKARFYLDAGQSTRRLMFTLAHAHGTLLSLVNIAFALSVAPRGPTPRALAVAGAALLAALVFLPGGFFLGGLAPLGGDPGLGVMLVPVGALALLLAVFLSARHVTRTPPPSG